MVFSMNKPTAKDFVEVVPSNNKIIKTSNGYLTNCVHPSHEDKKPSMGIMNGTSQVIVKCFSKDCPKSELLSYFYNRVPYYVESKKDWERSKKEWRKKQQQKREAFNGR